MKFTISELRKVFKIGDHVRATGGRHEGVTGTVVKLNLNEVIIVSDSKMEEVIRVCFYIFKKCLGQNQTTQSSFGQKSFI